MTTQKLIDNATQKLIDNARDIAPGIWTHVGAGLPDYYEEVRIQDEDGYERLGRRSKRSKGFWQIASFEREGSKYPRSDASVVAWARVFPTKELALVMEEGGAKDMGRTKAADMAAVALQSKPAQLLAGKVSRHGKRDRVRCPVCHKPNMRRVTADNGDSLISCVNTECVSNGGSNRNGLAVKESLGATADDVLVVTGAP